MKRLNVILAVLVSSLVFTACGAKEAKVETLNQKDATLMENKNESKDDMKKEEPMKDDAKKEMKDDMKKEGSKDQAKKEENTQMAPDFRLKDRDGKEFALSEQVGKKVYVKFWASWCHVCLDGMDDLAKLVNMDKDFEVVTIVSPNLGSEKSKEDFIKWYDEKGYDKNIRILFDENGEVAAKYGVNAYPTSLAVASDGTVAGLQAGDIPKDSLIEAFKQIK